MGSGIRGVVAGALCAFSLGAHAIASEWTVVDLTPDGAGTATAISQNGIVVGCRDTAIGQTRGFVYSNGHMRDLETPAGATSCALAVNNSGVVAGRIDGEITIWDSGSVRGIGIQGGVNGIDESGTIVGEMTEGPYNSPGPTRAFIWSRGALTDLGPGRAIGINQRGQVAVVSPPGNLYLYENGAMRNLNASVANAFGFNDRAEIVGMTSFGHGPAAFIYDGSVRPIPGDYGYSAAVAINNAGQVLGSGEGVYGFLLEGGHAMRLEHLPGVNSVQWRHMEGKAINDRGWIVGQGGGDFHAFLLVPKQTATTAITGNPAARAAPGLRPTVKARMP